MELKIDDRAISAIQGIEKALSILAAGDEVIKEVRAHMAEYDHPFTMRLIDLDVFGITCAHCPVEHYEWRPRL